MGIGDWEPGLLEYAGYTRLLIRPRIVQQPLTAIILRAELNVVTQFCRRSKNRRPNGARERLGNNSSYLERISVLCFLKNQLPLFAHDDMNSSLQEAQQFVPHQLAPPAVEQRCVFFVERVAVEDELL